jgi:hypothetical protein
LSFTLPTGQGYHDSMPQKPCGADLLIHWRGMQRTRGSALNNFGLDAGQALTATESW